ncbi:MAG: helix-turn-helix domain-containing protein, partial [Acidimicrobiia bacterium]
MTRPVDRRARTPTWVGTAWFGPWWLVYRGPVGVTAAHAHHALQAVLADSVDLLVGSERRSAPTVVPPNTVHRVATAADDATLVYVDGDLARQSPAAPLDRWSRHPAPTTWAAAAALAQAVCPLRSGAEPESAVVRAARFALADPDDGRSIEELAAHVGVSPSRLSHLFTASVGTPMRSYRRWQRLLLAAEAIAGGARLTEAAHAAGFADGPHLARTFRDHFGLSVTELTSG